MAPGNGRGQRGGRGGRGGGSSAGISTEGLDELVVPHRVEVDDEAMAQWKETLVLLMTQLDTVEDLATVSRIQGIMRLPVIQPFLADDDDGLRAQHEDLLELKAEALTAVAEAKQRLRDEERDRRMMHGLAQMSAQLTAAQQQTPGAGGMAGTPGGMGFSPGRPRTDTPKKLQPAEFTGELKDGQRTNAASWFQDMLSYISEAEAYETPAQKLRYIVTYFRGKFGDYWKARVKRRDPTPGFNFDEASSFGFDVQEFKEWFVKQNTHVGESMRLRTKFFSFKGTGMPLDEVLKELEILMEDANADADNVQDHITQIEFRNKFSKWCGENLLRACLTDERTRNHPQHPKVPPHEVLREHVLTELQIQGRMLTQNPSLGFNNPLPARLHYQEHSANFGAPREEVHLHNLNANGDTEGDDFLHALWEPMEQMTTQEDVSELTAIPCASLEEADDVAHVAQFNNQMQLNSLATSDYRAQRAAEMHGSPRPGLSSRDKTHDKCNKCGQLGHWARECTTPMSRQNFVRPQLARRRVWRFPQKQRDYTRSRVAGNRFAQRPGGGPARPPQRRYSFWKNGGAGTRLTEIPINNDTLRDAYEANQQIYMFDGDDEIPQQDQLFLLA